MYLRHECGWRGSKVRNGPRFSRHDHDDNRQQLRLIFAAVAVGCDRWLASFIMARAVAAKSKAYTAHCLQENHSLMYIAMEHILQQLLAAPLLFR